MSTKKEKAETSILNPEKIGREKLQKRQVQARD